MSHRTWVDGNVIDYQPFDGNVVYVLGSNGNLWREVGSMASRTLVASNVRSFQVATDGTGSTSTTSMRAKLLWETQNGSAPALLAYQVQAFQYASVAPYPLAVGGGDGTWGPGLYVLRPGNALWRGSAVYENHFQIDSNVSSFKAITGLEYFEEGTNGQLWRVSGPTVNVPSARALVDANVASFKPLTGQTIFVEDDSSNLWRGEFTARDRTRSWTRTFERTSRSVPIRTPCTSCARTATSGSSRSPPPLCKYSYAPTACTTTEGLKKGGQNDSFVEVWGRTDALRHLPRDRCCERDVDRDAGERPELQPDVAPHPKLWGALRIEREMLPLRVVVAERRAPGPVGPVHAEQPPNGGLRRMRQHVPVRWARLLLSGRRRLPRLQQHLLRALGARALRPSLDPQNGSFLMSTMRSLHPARRFTSSSALPRRSFSPDSPWRVARRRAKPSGDDRRCCSRRRRSGSTGNVSSFKAFPAISGLVYALHSDGNLWREVGSVSVSTPTWVDGNVIDYQPFDGNVIYVLGSNGNLWREVGSMANSNPGRRRSTASKRPRTGRGSSTTSTRGATSGSSTATPRPR